MTIRVKVKKIIIFVLGSTVLLIGVAMIALPGPAFIIIPAGLAILATEFVWARRWLQKVKDQGAKISSSVRRRKAVETQKENVEN